MYHAQHWSPTATLATLRRRAQLWQQVRDFFAVRNVMEVDTQMLSLASISDPHIEVLTTTTVIAGQPQTYYLQTSPEYAMKRLLCAGSGCIYQLGKVFRAEELGRRHAIEFTMLEWYRLGFDHWQLMQEVAELLVCLTGDTQLRCDYLSYADAFETHLNLNPHRASIEQLQQTAFDHTEFGLQETDRDTLLDVLFSHVIEPKIAQQLPCFIYDYPASQAALAKRTVNADQDAVAARFELYWHGMELANGYHELADPAEQQQRFAQEQQQRHTAGRVHRQVDERLVSALDQGLPECAGVALGMDRLLMLLTCQTHIDQVIAFAGNRA